MSGFLETARGRNASNVPVMGSDGELICPADFCSRIVVLDFFATWCRSYQEAGPLYQALFCQPSKWMTERRRP